MNCKTVPVDAKGKLNSWNGCAVVARRHGKMLPDVGMVQMYSKSANVNDLHGFCVDRLAPLFAWTGPPPCSYGFSASWFYVLKQAYITLQLCIITVLLNLLDLLMNFHFLQPFTSCMLQYLQE